MSDSIVRFQKALRTSKNIIVVAGAGLSAASGTCAITIIYLQFGLLVTINL